MIKKLKEHELIRVMSFMKSKIVLYFSSLIIHNLLDSLCLNIVTAFILKDVLNAAVNGEETLLIQAGIYVIIAFFIGEPIFCIFLYLYMKCVRTTITKIKAKSFSKTTTLPIDQFENCESGDLLTRLTNNVQSIEGIYSGQMGMLVFSILNGSIALTLIFIMEWRFGVIAVILGVTSICINWIFKTPIRKINDDVKEYESNLNSNLLNLLNGVTMSKMFHIEDKIHNKYMKTNLALSNAKIKNASINANLGIFRNIYQTVKSVGVLSLGLYMVIKQQIDVGSIAAIFTLQGYACYMFETVGQFITDIQSSMSGGKRVLDLLDKPSEIEKPQIYNQQANKNLPKDKNNLPVIQFKNVCFSYNQKEDSKNSYQVLNNVNLAVKKGKITALVGPSGGGKSTIIKLLLGFYPVREGCININGKSIGEYTLTQLRDKMAYVSQDSYLFTGTIEENIRYGKLNATTDEVIKAAKAANAHDFIMEQPEGYNTKVGEKGNKLSGGQKQRIAIARAILKDAPILLLDEATSALDSSSEKLVQDALDVLMKNRTTIVIAHRFSTIENANMIYVVDNGNVIEEGKHNDLLKTEGLYKKLYDLQFKQDYQMSIV